MNDIISLSFPPSLLLHVVYIHVCVGTYMCVCVYIHVYAGMCASQLRGQKAVYLSCYLSCILRQGLSLILELTDSAG